MRPAVDVSRNLQLVEKIDSPRAYARPKTVRESHPQRGGSQVPSSQKRTSCPLLEGMGHAKIALRFLRSPAGTGHKAISATCTFPARPSRYPHEIVRFGRAAELARVRVLRPFP